MQIKPISEEQLFHAARQIENVSSRAEFLKQACGNDQALKARIEGLLRNHDAPHEMLDPPEMIATADFRDLTEKPGTQIGPYKLLQQIGEGGFGVVYLAEQHKPVRRKVALKIIKPGMDTKEVIARFEAERQALALMDHPNIAKVLDAGATESGRPYFVMELVRGVPITEFCDEQKLSTRERLNLFVDICRAIQHAHQKGIIHRDLKPTNVMVTLDDNRPIPKVIDFGISKALSQQLTEKTLFTAYGQMIGTPLYMAPEQAQMNMRDVDTRSDVYSLGVLLYELLTGTTPFDKDTLQKSGFDAMRRIICEVEPPRPSARISTLNAEMLSTVSDKRKVDSRKLSQSLRGELDWIVMKALEKDRNRRYESASAFAADVERFLADEPVQACPPSAWYRMRKHARRHQAALSLMSVTVVAALLVAAAVGWTVSDRADRRRDAARDRAQQQELIEASATRALDLSTEFMRERKWRSALAEAARAASILDNGPANHSLRQRVTERNSDMKMLLRLDEFRTSPPEPSFWRNRGGSRSKAYERAFREYGIDVATLSSRETARLFREREIHLELAFAVDAWGFGRRSNEVRDSDLRLKLIQISRSVDANPWRNRVRVDAERGDQDALRKLAKDPSLIRQPVVSLTLLADALYRLGDKRAAVDVLLRCHLQRPDDFGVCHRLSLWCLDAKIRRVDDALRFSQAAAALRPTSPGVFNNLGNALKRKGRLDEAIAAYRAARRVGGNEWEWAPFYVNFGGVLLEKGQPEQALSSFKKAVNIDPKLSDAHYGIGGALGRLKKQNDALASYRQAIKVGPKNATAHYNLGISLAALNRRNEAIASYRRAIEIDPSRFQFHHNLGNELKHCGELERAEESYRAALKLAPDFSLSQIGLAHSLALRSKFDEAIVSYRKAIRLAPRSGRAHNGLAWCLIATHNTQLRNPSEALVLARRAVQFEPAPWKHWYTLSRAAFEIEDWDQVNSALHKIAERSDSVTAEMLLMSSVVDAKRGYKRVARKTYERVVGALANGKIKPSPRITSLQRMAAKSLGIPVKAERPRSRPATMGNPM